VTTDPVAIAIVALPALTFAALALAERVLPAVAAHARPTAADHAVNLAGLAVQGTVVPALGYALSAVVLPHLWPEAQGVLGLGFAGAFVLCFVGVDFLYYWQHRAFHRAGVLWRLHRCHHAAPVVSVWSTARNSFVTHFLFVYLVINPWLAFLSGSVQGFMLAAAITASLDLWRHSRLVPRRYWSALETVLVTPRMHHRHHDALHSGCNYGANLSLWDRLFGTLREGTAYPASYAVADAPGPWSQLAHPLRIARGG